jgi:hypothetical protein
MGLVLYCDTCGAKFTGDPNQHRLHHWSNQEAMRKEAQEAGWTVPVTLRPEKDEPDLCPDCQQPK